MLEGIGLIIEILTLVVLVVSARAIWWQLRQQEQRHHTDQKIAWKNSALELNKLAMAYPDIFRKVLYPRTKNTEEVQKYTSAYSSLHALEVMYYMRKDEEQGTDRLDTFLREYVDSQELRAAWRVEAAHTAFTKEFQEQLNAIIDKYPLKDKEAPAEEAEEESRKAGLVKVTPTKKEKGEEVEKEIWISASQIASMEADPSSTLLTLTDPLPPYSSEDGKMRVQESPETIKRDMR